MFRVDYMQITLRVLFIYRYFLFATIIIILITDYTWAKTEVIIAYTEIVINRMANLYI